MPIQTNLFGMTEANVQKSLAEIFFQLRFIVIVLFFDLFGQ